MFGVLIGLPAYLLRRVQSVQNAAARLIFRLRRSDHITDALLNLHWLRIAEHIEFKIAVLVYKVLHGQEPHYLRPRIRVADLPDRPVLRSILVPTVCMSHMSDCLLSTVGPSRSPDRGTIYLNM